MNRRTLYMAALFASMGGAFSIAACASNESNDTASDGTEGNETIVGSNVPDASVDVMVSAVDVDAGPCADCEWFPADCTPKALCGSGPFDPSTVGGAIDGRIRIHTIRGRSDSDVWAGGALGAVAHFDGTSWTRLDIGDRTTTEAMWLREDTELLLTNMQNYHSPVTEGGVTSWLSINLKDSLDTPFPASLTSVIALTSAWAAEGATWMWCTSVDTVPTDPTNVATPGLWRLRYTTTKARGFEVAEALPPGTCGTIPCKRMNGVHGLDANELWAVGNRGATVHVTGADSDIPEATAFNSMTLNELRAVWTASAAEAWSVGAAGTIRHYLGDPLRWEVVDDLPVTADLNAVWGTSPSDVWAVGDDAVVLHYDGLRWSRVPVGGLGERRPKLTTVWTSSPGHVWIGGDGFVLSLGGKS